MTFRSVVSMACFGDRVEIKGRVWGNNEKQDWIREVQSEADELSIKYVESRKLLEALTVGLGREEPGPLGEESPQ